MNITLAFDLIVQLAEKLDVHHINELPGPWVHKLDSKWTFALNGKSEVVDYSPADSMGATLQPMQCGVFYNGWLAALMYPNGGTFVSGSCANEDAFIEALRAQLDSLPATGEVR